MAEYYIGLMSGTSMDGIDAVLIDASSTPPLSLAYLHYPLPPALRERLLNLAEDHQASLDDFGHLDSEMGVQFARAALDLLDQVRIPNTQVRAIGSHGQTVRHRPDGPNPFSLQIGDPNRIVALTGITTVADFRRRDLALGGQGAPLVPAFHAACLRSPKKSRVVLNLGGMANITLLPTDPALPVSGYDTGPANVLLDAWCQRHQSTAYDPAGQWAGKGQVIPELLNRLLAHEYFPRPPPKSTGRETFHLGWLEAQLRSLQQIPAAQDVQSTLATFTAKTIADAICLSAAGNWELLVCGGGVHNQDLLARIACELPKMQLCSTAEHGLDPDRVEAMAFAWLAQQTLSGKPGNLPAVTGAHGRTVLGGIYPAFS